MTVATTHAVKPPATAIAPPVQRKVEPSIDHDEAPRRLLTSLTAVPTVQRACAGCAGEDDEKITPVMPKLEVGPVDDPYEREADNIAGRVMAIRDTGSVRRVVEDDEPDVMARRVSVQRKCASCGSDDTPVMPRLEVGPVDDPYEREADDIAGRVMAMRAPIDMLKDNEEAGGIDTAASVARRPILQRKCAACADKDDQMPVQPLRTIASVQRAPASLLESDALRDLTDMPRMKANVGAGTEHISASAGQLSAGGSALSPDTRNFFESRMGRDLSQVRIHKGEASNELNTSISSRAFTFRNHIWLSRSENEGPSFTMAHEMAHVLQQTQPAPVRAKRRNATSVRALIQRAPQLKFASRARWSSEKLEVKNKKKTAGTQIHEDVLPQFQAKHTQLLIEAKIPISKPSPKGNLRTGEADLFIGKGKDDAGTGTTDRTIGVNFITKGNPVNIRSKIKQPFHSANYRHNKSARPNLKKGQIVNADKAPTDISMGELKPEHSKSGTPQLRGYEVAIKRTQIYANDYISDKNKINGTTDPLWPEPSFSRISVAPPSLTGKNGKSFGRHKLLVYQFAGMTSGSNFAMGSLLHTPSVDVFGELKVKKHTDGIYYYWWEPEVKATSTNLPAQLATQAALTDKLFTALKSNRKVVLPKRISAQRGKPSVAARCTPKVHRSLSRPSMYTTGGRITSAHSRVMRRKSRNAKKFPNHFDAKFEKNKWLPNRTKVAAAYSKVAKSQSGTKGPAALTDWYLIEINKDLGSGDRQNLHHKLKPGGNAYKRTRQLRKMHILSQRFAPAMAKLRRMFGGVFARGSALYEKIKSKFDKRSKPKATLSGGGILGALIKASFKVLGLIGRQIVASTMIQLTEQLKGCMTKMFETYFSIDDKVEDIQARIDGVKANVEAKVNAFIGGNVDTLADTLFGPYGQQVDQIRSFVETMTKTAKPILTAYKVVRWGILALACVSPPLVGCLWGLAAKALEWAAAKVMDTCWFMKKVTPKILKIKQIKSFMSSTSLVLSNGIIDAGASLFPDPVGSFLKNSCKAKTPKISMPKSSSICQEGGGSGGMGNDPKPSQEALDFWERWEKLSFAKQMALKKMLGVKNAAGGAKVNWDKLNKMLDWANSHSLADMTKIAAKAAKGDSSAIPGAVSAVKKAAEGYKASGDKSKGSGTASDTKPKGSGGGSDDGDTGGDTTVAKRSTKKPVSGGTATDLHPYLFIPETTTPPTKDKTITGDIYVTWRQKKGDPKIIKLEKVTLIYKHDLPSKKLGGEEYARWMLEASKDEGFEVEGRAKGFFFSKGAKLPLFTLKLSSK